MAGLCTGGGLSWATGELTLLGPREQEWANESGCPIDTWNGLAIDPVTGKLWAPPQNSVRMETDTAAGSLVVPTGVATDDLSDLEVELTTGECVSGYFEATLSGGFAGWRAASGNFWTVQRYVTVYLDGVPTAFTGMQVVSAIENNSGGVLSSGNACDGYSVGVLTSPGQEVRVVAHYELDVLTYTANAANGLQWRPPELRGVLWSRRT